MTADEDLDDMRRAARMLLTRPLLRAGGEAADIAAAVRRPELRTRLQQWFDHNLGWELVVDRDVIRLNKVPTRTRCGEHDAPTQRTCVLYCLILAALEECGDQVVISEIAEMVGALASTRPEINSFDSDVFSDRRDLVRALRLLVDQGVLVHTRDAASTEKDERAYEKAEGNAIYDVDHRAAALILACPVPPTKAGTPTGMTAQPLPDTASGHNRRRRHGIMRRLVDEPVLYVHELTDDELTYYQSQRHALVREVEQVLDVRVEIRAEGAAVIDEELTDLRFPAERTPQFAALLLAGALAAEPGVGTDSAAVIARYRLEELASWLAGEVAGRVKTIEGGVVTPESVLGAALTVLYALRLVEPAGDGVRALPALGRFRPSADTPMPPVSGGRLLDDLAAPDSPEGTES
ncbi:TIGR02678 family protein [Actinokineospora enzanensis]|uniref:TIGR02678 family protein n=1 Tax=Actinokineospora enzanensis TaxID=155975 RepID=UPI00035EFA1F|nr:TIGR02678 family protein [Actinokineospora enzanensis]